MQQLKRLVSIAAVVVLVICFYAFFLSNEVFEGKFKNDAIGWYFLGKGIFCSLSLYLSVCMLDALSHRK